jgi:hypothetical protein
MRVISFNEGLLTVPTSLLDKGIKGLDPESFKKTINISLRTIRKQVEEKIITSKTKGNNEKKEENRNININININKRNVLNFNKEKNLNDKRKEIKRKKKIRKVIP